MTAASPGSIVGIYMDTTRTLDPGDYIQTGTGRVYEIQAVRVQQRGVHVGRQHLRVVVMPPEFDLGAAIAAGARAIPLVWYRR